MMNQRLLLLSSIEIEDISKELPQWNLRGNTLERNFTFNNFLEAFGFICQVSLLSESMNHHPDWSNSYNKVKISLTTHDLGGLSSNDIKLARAINEIL